MKTKTNLDFLYYFAFATFLFGTKLWLISAYGNATPYWDQWDAEADHLYKPFIDGTLKFTDLLASHNEHRILTTRLLSLTELSINGIWNPLFQMVVNAGLHIFSLTIAIGLMARVIGRDYLPALLCFSAFLFSLPFGWENTLAGFQAQFYFVLLFSILSLWFTTTHEPFSLKWCGGLFFSVLAFFSLASGIFCVAASAVIAVIYYLFGLRKTNRQLIAAVFLSALFIIGFSLTPVIAAHQFLKAGSVLPFLKALFHILWWPSPNKLLGLLQNTPILIFGFLVLRQKPSINDNKWFLISLLIWIAGTASSVAYGRAISPLSSRYLDLFTISIFLNFSCLLLIVKESENQWKKYAFSGSLIWLLSVGTCLQMYNSRPIQPSLRVKKTQSAAEEVNTKKYVATGKIACLKNKPQLDIPYPSSDRLASLLDTPEIRKILPSNIAPSDRIPKEGRLDGMINLLLANYYIFIVIGLLTAMIGVLLVFFGSAKKGEKVPM